MRSPLLPKFTLQAARAAQLRASRISSTDPAAGDAARVAGFSTPAVRDVGGASLRVRFAQPGSIEDGGYLLAIRAAPENAWLPAIAGVPGDKGLDRHGKSRVGLAELMVMGRPLGRQSGSDGDGGCIECTGITFLSEESLQQLFPDQAEVEVVRLARLTSFFLGLNAGRWLTIRMSEIADSACKALAAAPALAPAPARAPAARAAEGFANGAAGRGGGGGDGDGDGYGGRAAEQELERLLRGTGIACAARLQPPPEDSAYLFDHWGAGGNSGVSGQRIVLKDEDPTAKL
jgi:hypothetical protein